jgi:hypothetical protein
MIDKPLLNFRLSVDFNIKLGFLILRPADISFIDVRRYDPFS